MVDQISGYQKLITKGTVVLFDYSAQISNITVLLTNELKDYNNQNKSIRNEATASIINIKAYKSSVILLMSSFLEMTLNFLAQITIQANKKEEGSPQIVNELNLIEVDFLLEKESKIDLKTAEIMSKTSYIRFKDKLLLYPKILAKLYGSDFVFNKSDSRWVNIMKLKELRDGLTHPRLDSETIRNIDIMNVDDIHNVNIITIGNIILVTLGIIAYLESILDQIINGVFINQPYTHIINQNFRKVICSFTMVLQNLCLGDGMKLEKFNGKYGYLSRYGK